MRYITLATGHRTYFDRAIALARYLTEAGHWMEIHTGPYPGSKRQACYQKAFLCHQQIQQGPLIFIDADSTISGDPPLPELTELSGYDLAVVPKGLSHLPFEAGLLFFNDTPAARHLLELWARRCRAGWENPQAEADHRILCGLWKENQLQTGWLDKRLFSTGSNPPEESHIRIGRSDREISHRHHRAS